MFEGSVFLIITSESFNDSDEINKLTSILEGYDATFIIKDDGDSKINYLENQQSPAITNIISKSINFNEYILAQEVMIPVTTPNWIFESIESNKILNPKIFNPDPKYFMKDCFICVADNLPSGDKDSIYECIRAFGGQFLDDLTKYTTHLIAMDVTNEKSIIASSATNNNENDEKVDIKIVLPHWLDDCIKYGKKVDETPYLLPDPLILKSQVINSSLPSSSVRSMIESQEPNSPLYDSDLLKDKSFYLSSDYHLSERLSETVKALIARHGGKVLNIFDKEKVDVYVGQYRVGDSYIDSCKSDAIVVGNLQWLYSIIVTNRWVLPAESNLLHYPIPIRPIDAFRNLKISITNFSGDARIYLSRLITILGGTFTRTLTKDNDYLIAAKSEGKKYEAAKSKWSFQSGNGNIKIVNNLWLEECFAAWQLLNYKDARFQLSEDVESVQNQLGKTRLDKEVLKNWYDKEELNNDNIGIDDSMSEDEITHQNNGSFDKEKSKKIEEKIPKEGEVENKEEDIKDNTELERVDEGDRVNVNGQNTKNKHNQKKESSKDNNSDEISQFSKLSQLTNTSKRSQITSQGKNKENIAPSNPILSRSGRTAARRAALKLHSDMSELNNYQEISKSARKMKSYMEELENTLTPSKRKTTKTSDSEETSPPQAKKKKSNVSEAQNKIVAIMTGCEQEITLSRSDLTQFANLGIKILSDFSNKFTINTLIAPKILRTEKFLKSLSKVDKIIHPNYLIDILKKDNLTELSWNQISKEFNINDYSLDKLLPVKEINLELGIKSNDINGLNNLIKSDKKGRIFEDLSFNLSTNLNGGVEVVSRILSSHGSTEFKSVKSLNSLSNTKHLLKSKNDRIILVAHKTKDYTLINNFKKFLPNEVIIEWDWCVKSIFRMDLQDFNDFKL